MKAPVRAMPYGASRSPSPISLAEWSPQMLEDVWARDVKLRRRLLRLNAPEDVNDTESIREFVEYAQRLAKFMERELPANEEAIRVLWPAVSPVIDALEALAEQVSLICYGPAELPPAAPPVAMKARSGGTYQRPTGGTYVYVARKGTEVLYVGITDDIFHRMSAHRRSSKWWKEFTDLSWEEWPDRHEAESRERRLIARHCPRFNWVHNPSRGTA